MDKTLERLGYDKISRESRPLLGEDFVFQTTAFRSADQFKEAHTELHFEETPLAVIRDIYLEHAQKPHPSLHLTLGLAWNGFRDSLILVARFAGAFQRAIPESAVFNTADREGIGDFGVAWAWEGTGDPEILAFARNNVFVGIQSHDANEHTLALAKEIDEKLRTLKTTDAYEEESVGLAAEVRQRERGAPRVDVGGRLDLGVPREDRAIFFLTSSGSVNRDPATPTLWYLRAGAEKGTQEVTIFTVGPGLLPKKERLIVEVA